MNIDTLLDELGRRFDIAGLRLDGNDVCRILFDEALAVDVQVDRPNETIYFHAVVASQDECATAEVLGELLSANLLGVNGHDNYLGLDRVRRELVLFSRLPESEPDYERFATRLEHFLDDLEHWVDRFGRAGIGRDVAPSENAPEHAAETPSFGRQPGFRV